MLLQMSFLPGPTIRAQERIYVCMLVPDHKNPWTSTGNMIAEANMANRDNLLVTWYSIVS